MEVHHRQRQYTDVNLHPGCGGGGDGGDRFSQWSHEETKELLAIRSELHRSFMETKRNKLLWAAISARMEHKGFHRTPAQCRCKWKNLVSRYKGSESMEAAVRQQFPFHDDMRRMLSGRVECLFSLGEGVRVWSEDNVAKDNKACEGGQESSKKRKAGGGDGTHGSIVEVEKTLKEFMGWWLRAESRWLEANEACEAERREKEAEWRRAMEALATERTRMEKRWREREEERRAREEARAERRHALVAALLAKLAHKGL